MATTARGIIYPTVSDTLTPLANRFASLATSTNTAIDNATLRVASYEGTDAQRLAITGSTVPVLKEGLEWYSTDTNKRWFYDGATWVTGENGMYLIEPTSVAGTGVTFSGGRINFSASPSVSANGVFTSRFRNYKIIFRSTLSAATATGIRLRASGVDLNGANTYANSFIYKGTDAGANGSYSTSDYAPLTGQSGTNLYLQTEVFSPQLTDNAMISNFGLLGGAVGVSFSQNWVSSLHTVTTAADGFTVIAAAGGGTFTGSASVYAYA